MGRITGLNKRNWSSGVYKVRGTVKKHKLVDSPTVKTPFRTRPTNVQEYFIPPFLVE